MWRPMQEPEHNSPRLFCERSTEGWLCSQRPSSCKAKVENVEPFSRLRGAGSVPSPLIKHQV